jgi:hemolysin D
MWGSGLVRAMAVARAAAAAERTGRPRPRRSRHELEFLPAALEVMDTPPSPARRALVLVIVAFAILAIGWSWIGRLDVVAVAPGRIIPSGKVKVVQPVEIAVVRAIHVRDGQRVRRGEVLITLDPTATAADRERLGRELSAARAEARRLRAGLGDASAATPFDDVPGLDPQVAGVHRSLLDAHVGEHQARLASLDREAARRAAERAATEAHIAKLEKTMPLVRDRADSFEKLARDGFVARLAYVEVQQVLLEHEGELAAQREKRAEATAAIESLREQRRQVEHEFRRVALDRLTEVTTRVSSLAQELAKAERRDQLQRLAAPIAGVVQQLAVHTVGGVVTPAQPLMVVVPADSGIEIEAQVLNRDAGFVRAGQDAEVKVETFLFTKYGLVPGRVTHVATDATHDERLGLVYVAQVALARTFMHVDGVRVPLAPGMVVTAEIKTDRRRLIEYLLSPLLRYRQESLRER